jgi:hypothetical protein
VNDAGSIFASKELLDIIPEFVEGGKDPLENAELKIGVKSYSIRILHVSLNELSLEILFKTNKEDSLTILRESLNKRLQVSILPGIGKFIISCIELASSYEIKLLAARVNN